MNYKKIYNALINTRKNRPIHSGVYYENHHILPRCFGGKRSKDNLVYLTYREHFIAHKLLFLFTTGKEKTKMGYALHRLCKVNNSTQNYRVKNSREFEKIKIQVYEFIQGSNHPGFGSKLSEEKKKKISERMLGKNNHRYGKDPWNKGLTKETDDRIRMCVEKAAKTNSGRTLSKDHRKSISESLKGKNTYTRSESHREKISKTLKDRKLPESVCKKMSMSRKGVPQKKIKCPFCDKVGGTTMYRWHFDNCKYKEVNDG